MWQLVDLKQVKIDQPLVSLTRLDPPSPQLNFQNSNPLIHHSPKDNIYSQCTKCPNYSYATTDEFRDHSKSEWHQYNVRNPIHQKSYSEWSMLSGSVDDSGSSESSSLNGSSDDEQTDEPYLSNTIVLSGVPYTIVIGNKYAILKTIPSLNLLLDAKYIAVLLMRSGRFAGAVWDHNQNMVSHTTLKRYTVRRKNGGSQAKSDKIKGSSANSAGAQIRRAQEKKLSEEVFEVLTKKWIAYLSSPDTLVFAYASKSHVPVLFAGPLARDSKNNYFPNILKIPLSVGTPTHEEVCRVYSVVTRVALWRTLGDI